MLDGREVVNRRLEVDQGLVNLSIDEWHVVSWKIRDHGHDGLCIEPEVDTSSLVHDWGVDVVDGGRHVPVVGDSASRHLSWWTSQDNHFSLDIRHSDFKVKPHLVKMIEIRHWFAKKFRDGRQAVGDCSDRWVRIELVVLAQHWGWNVKLQILRVKNDDILLWHLPEKLALDEDMRTSSERGLRHASGAFAVEIDSLRNLEFLLSVTNTCEVVLAEGRIQSGKEQHQQPIVSAVHIVHLNQSLFINN